MHYHDSPDPCDLERVIFNAVSRVIILAGLSFALGWVLHFLLS